MSIKPGTDPRTIRTRTWLKHALLELIREKPYREINIAEITDRAGLARPTFYLHYRSKNDLLLSYLDELFSGFITEIEEDLLSTEIDAGAATKIFTQVQEHSHLFQVVLHSGEEQQLLKRFQSYVLIVFARFIKKNNLANLSAELVPYVADYLAGAIIAMISDWLENDQPHPPAVMGKVFYALAQPGLSNVLVKRALNPLE